MIRRSLVTATLALTIATGVAAPAQAQIPPGSSTFDVVLPKQLLDLADRLGIMIPAQFRPDDTPAQTAEIRGRLKSVTEKHLTEMGHKPNDRAAEIAQEWANQAANGQVVFHGNAGDGITHLDKGSGNIYRLTPQQAEDHINWLNRKPNEFPHGQGFGVATTAKGGYIYLAEYFLS